MPKKFPYAELRSIAAKLPMARENWVLGDFDSATQNPQANAISGMAKLYLKAYESQLAPMDLSGVPKRFETTIKLAAACAMHNALRTTTLAEATLAGVSLPVFTRQKLLVIQRAYPNLMALQLFGFLPMQGPTARMFFKTYQYASALTTSSPNIAAGDVTNDLTKVNKAYTQVNEGVNSRKVTFKYSSLDISTLDYRVTGEWSDQLVDDMMAVYDDDAVASHMDTCTWLMGLTVDRTMIDAMVAAVPTANKQTFTCKPTSNPDYNSLTPSEQDHYDERLFKDGIVPLIEKIRTTNKFSPAGEPNWALCDPQFAGRLRRIKGFTARADLDPAELEMGQGAPRDIGVIGDFGVRVLVDPMLNIADQTTGKLYFGRRPIQKNDPALYLGMYVPAEMTRDVYNPSTGLTEKGVRSRFAVAAPNTGTNADSAELARCYGELTVTL